MLHSFTEHTHAREHVCPYEHAVELIFNFGGAYSFVKVAVILKERCTLGKNMFLLHLQMYRWVTHPVMWEHSHKANCCSHDSPANGTQRITWCTSSMSNAASQRSMEAGCRKELSCPRNTSIVCPHLNNATVCSVRLIIPKKVILKIEL